MCDLFCRNYRLIIIAGQNLRNKKAPKLLHFRAITLKKWSRFSDLNRRPHPYHGCALPAELNRRWWWNMDLNHGRLPSTDLQSVAIDHSAIPPYCLCYVFCCQSYLVLTGAGKGIRTSDLLITSQLLYRLSYTGFNNSGILQAFTHSVKLVL